jgi:hypothetical protein
LRQVSEQGALRAKAQERSYTSAEAAGFRRQWNLDNWDDGGPLTRVARQLAKSGLFDR